MHPHKRKMIAPIVISAVFIIYYAVYFGLLLSLLDGVWKYILGAVPLGFSAIMIRVCMERIKEIKGGNEDDIGQY